MSGDGYSQQDKPESGKTMQDVDAGLARVRESFALQGAMTTMGASISHLSSGAVDIEFDWSESLTQQHGFIHAGMLSTAMDSACGYAGFSVMPPQAGVLTIEYKVNLLAPARGSRFRCEGRVIKPGRTILVAEGKAYELGEDGQNEKLIATMTCTLMAVQGRAELAGR